MKIEKLPNEFEKARPVMQQIEEGGYQAYFVGGSVRDTILGLPIHDVDIASSAYPQEIKQIFKKTVDTGIEHGTVMVLYNKKGYEITTFRTESGYQDYRRPDKVEFVRSLDEDLKRRDFTINAFAMRENGEVTDLFDGLEDIQKRLIRAVGNPNERFNEDALRMMRAVRFASKLDFDIEEKTMSAIKENSHLLDKIAVERIYTEFVKMMMANRPKQGISDMLNTDMYKYVPVFGNYPKQLEAITKVDNLTLLDEIEVWSFIAFNFAMNRNEISSMLKKWKASNDIIKNTQQCVDAINNIKQDRLDEWEMYQTGEDLLIKANHIAKLYGFEQNESDLISKYEHLNIKDKKEMAINGGDLIKSGVVKPGPEMGKILFKLEKALVCNEIDNDKESLIEAAKNF
ncbi:MAG: CCA tRNA nucleotidyltransferase [Apilactobacillus sp.]|uniref:CCA tRNA nucleotidyltransferase n=1 Tax=Apilactobacillus sp. TaxID=2767901 RepID=UPI0025D58255|nr:CCA tRNA nucleotidyltransferase [Apilactobacillus sp.]MCT6822407.1 CCA tRNA nucleotidyltransferase [Apilactobacillus sp.]MCT6858611.1 CCA tRNA nucleotidyltransferase [Apilactobacillus sp.]